MSAAQPNAARQPERLAFEMPKVTYRSCSRCGAQSSGVECHDCWTRGTSDDEIRSRREKRERRTAFEAAMPEWSRDVSFDKPARLTLDVPYREAIERARRAVGAPKVVLFGPTGTGKTFLVAAMIRAWFERNDQPAEFVPTYRLNGKSWELPPSVEWAGLVVLDGVGSELPSKSNLVPSAVAARDFHRRPLWVTTQLDEDEMAARYKEYGEEVARKVFERAVVIPMNEAAAGIVARWAQKLKPARA